MSSPDFLLSPVSGMVSSSEPGTSDCVMQQGTLWGRGTLALGRGQSNTTRPVHLGYWQNWKRKHCPLTSKCLIMYLKMFNFVSQTFNIVSQTFNSVSLLPIMCSRWWGACDLVWWSCPAWPGTTSSPSCRPPSRAPPSPWSGSARTQTASGSSQPYNVIIKIFFF